MPYILVHLGTRYATPDQPPFYIAVEIDREEFTPEQVFVACNRIESCWTDCTNLANQWQRVFRYALEQCGCPSMSPEDEIWLTDLHGKPVAHWRCLAIGWETVTEPELRQFDEHGVEIAHAVVEYPLALRDRLPIHVQHHVVDNPRIIDLGR